MGRRNPQRLVIAMLVTQSLQCDDDNDNDDNNDNVNNDNNIVAIICLVGTRSTIMKWYKCNNVIITSLLRKTTLVRRFDLIMTHVRHVSIGLPVQDNTLWR